MIKKLSIAALLAGAIALSACSPGVPTAGDRGESPGAGAPTGSIDDTAHDPQGRPSFIEPSTSYVIFTAGGVRQINDCGFVMTFSLNNKDGLVKQDVVKGVWSFQQDSKSHLYDYTRWTCVWAFPAVLSDSLFPYTMLATDPKSQDVPTQNLFIKTVTYPLKGRTYKMIVFTPVDELWMASPPTSHGDG